jgi:hypothetical protein
MSAPVAEQAAPLPRNSDHQYFSIPTYPGYAGICECGEPFGERMNQQAAHRKYREHFAEVARADALSA